MNVLTFSAGESGCALEAVLVRQVVAAGDPLPPVAGVEYHLGILFPDHDASWTTRVVLEVEEHHLVLWTTVPKGFMTVDPERLVPVPPFVFSGGRRLVRAVFHADGRPHLLLDEAELSRRALAACT